MRAPIRLEPTGDGFAIEAGDLGALLGLSAEEVRREMRENRISTRFEKGEGEDAGTWRVTFRRGRDRAQLTVDDAGREIGLSRVAWTSPPRPLAPSDLREVVEAFYARVRRDEVLGPLFEDAVHDWPAHLERLSDFWSSMMLGSGAYKGDPFGRHLEHASRMDPRMFDRWLALWRETTEAMLPAPAASAAQEKAGRIARSLRMALFPQDAGGGFRMPEASGKAEERGGTGGSGSSRRVGPDLT